MSHRDIKLRPRVTATVMTRPTAVRIVPRRRAVLPNGVGVPAARSTGNSDGARTMSAVRATAGSTPSATPGHISRTEGRCPSSTSRVSTTADAATPRASATCHAMKNDTEVLAPPTSGTGLPASSSRRPDGNDRMKPSMKTVMVENVPPSTR